MIKYKKYVALTFAFMAFGFLFFRANVDNIIDKNECPFIRSGWVNSDPDKFDLMPLIFVEVVDKKISWNKYIINEDQFNYAIKSQKKLDPQPILIFNDEVSTKNCQFASRIQAKIDKTIDCKNSKLCGFGTRQDWKGVALSSIE